MMQQFQCLQQALAGKRQKCSTQRVDIKTAIEGININPALRYGQPAEPKVPEG